MTKINYIERDRLQLCTEGYANEWTVRMFSVMERRFLIAFGAMIMSWRPAKWSKYYAMEEMTRIRMIHAMKMFLNFNKADPVLFSLGDLEDWITNYIKADPMLFSIEDLKAYLPKDIGNRRKLICKCLQEVEIQRLDEYYHQSLFNKENPESKYRLPPHVEILSDDKNGWYNDSGSKDHTLIDFGGFLSKKERDTIMESMIKRLFFCIQEEKAKNWVFNKDILYSSQGGS